MKRSLYRKKTQYRLAQIAYWTLTNTPCQGDFPPLDKKRPLYHKGWNSWIERALTVQESPTKEHQKGFDTMHKLVEAMQEVAVSYQALKPKERKLIQLTPPKGMSLVAFSDKVELGAFDGPTNEQPRFRAEIAPFFIDQKAVSCREFERFMPSYQRSSYSNKDNSPATLISQKMAEAYCQWRTQIEGVQDNPYRLPTEYEWEAACRGDGGDQYPWGQNFQAHQIHTSTQTTAVDAKAQLRFGLYQMLGNIWEWTATPFRAHPFSKEKDPGYNKGLITVKGGSFSTPIEKIRASLRAGFRKTDCRANIGFRCVRSVTLEEDQQETV